MNCYEWQHQINLTGMSISANCAYQIPNPDPEGAPLDVTITGAHSYPDVGPPYPRRAMRCGTGYTSYYAKRSNWTGWDRFYILTSIQSYEFSPLVVTTTDNPDRSASILTGGFSSFPTFISGLFKPEDTDDPSYVCADGVWRKSTEITKGFVQIVDELEEPLAFGFYNRIENGAEITYYRPDDLETSIGTGTITYALTPA